MKKVEWNIVRLGHRQKVASFTAWGEPLSLFEEPSRR